MKTYQVLRQHLGDKMYMPGDPETGTREANPSDVKHLVDAGVLKEVKSKTEKAPANKAEAASPKNKSK
ncbi:hypothetical protein ABIA16_001748 [Sinorhizobium fredii]